MRLIVYSYEAADDYVDLKYRQTSTIRGTQLSFGIWCVLY